MTPERFDEADVSCFVVASLDVEGECGFFAVKGTFTTTLRDGGAGSFWTCDTVVAMQKKVLQRVGSSGTTMLRVELWVNLARTAFVFLGYLYYF